MANDPYELEISELQDQIKQVNNAIICLQKAINIINNSNCPIYIKEGIGNIALDVVGKYFEDYYGDDQ